MAKADENDSTEPTSPTSSPLDDGIDRPDGRAEAWSPQDGVGVPESSSEPAEYDAASRAEETDAHPLDDESPADTDTDEESRGEDDADLVAVGAPPGGRPKRSGAKRKAAKKDEPTPKQRSVVEGPGRTSPPQFIRQSVAELRKVVYPTGQQLLNYFVVVLIFVLFIIAVVSLLDLAFGWVILRVFS